MRHLHLTGEDRAESDGVPHRSRKRRSTHRERLAFHIAGDIAIGLLEQNDHLVVPLEVNRAEVLSHLKRAPHVLRSIPRHPENRLEVGTDGIANIERCRGNIPLNRKLADVERERPRRLISARATEQSPVVVAANAPCERRRERMAIEILAQRLEQGHRAGNRVHAALGEHGVSALPLHDRLNALPIAAHLRLNAQRARRTLQHAHRILGMRSYELKSRVRGNAVAGDAALERHKPHLRRAVALKLPNVVEIDEPLLAENQREHPVCSEGNLRCLSMLCVVLDVLPADFLVPADHNANPRIIGNHPVVAQVLRSIQRADERALVVDGAPSKELAVLDDALEGVAFPPITCGNHVDMAQHADDMLARADIDLQRIAVELGDIEVELGRLRAHPIKARRDVLAKRHARLRVAVVHRRDGDDVAQIADEALLDVGEIVVSH